MAGRAARAGAIRLPVSKPERSTQPTMKPADRTTRRIQAGHSAVSPPISEQPFSAQALASPVATSSSHGASSFPTAK